MRIATTLVFLAAALVTAQTANAQTAPGSASRWEIGVHAGASFLQFTSDGQLTLPDAGPAITTSSPIFPSRQIPSWFFGDGATLLNDALADLGLSERVTPLDNALRSVGTGNSSTWSLGGRVSYLLKPSMALQFDFDMMPATDRLSVDLLEAAGDTKQSFATAFSALLGSGPFSNVAVMTFPGGGKNPSSTGELAATAALSWRFANHGGFVPYATFGGGMTTGLGSGGSVTLQTNYRATVTATPSITINESEHVTVRFEQVSSLVGVIGGGVRRDVSGSLTLVIDARALLGQPTSQIRLDASPSVTTSSPAGFIESFTYPSIQFSTDPATGRVSTLSAPKIEDLVVFSPGGMRARFLITAGITKRF